MRIISRTFITLSVLLFSGGMIFAQSSSYDQSEVAARVTSVKKGSMQKIGFILSELYRSKNGDIPLLTSKPNFKGTHIRKVLDEIVPVVDGRVVVDAVAKGYPDSLSKDLSRLGMKDITTYGRYVSGSLPIKALKEMSRLESLKFARPSLALTQKGRVTSQGISVMGATPLLKEFKSTGKGVSIGVLSDSYDCLKGADADVLSGDLPSDVTVLAEENYCMSGSDEGRALMQIVHDVAPESKLFYHSAFNGFADFANGILKLRENAFADIIVDDVLYLYETMFQDDLIAQAVDQVVSDGAAYFSSAGNSGSESYEEAFRNSGITGVFDGYRHDFDEGEGLDTFQTITLPKLSITIIAFQWDEPAFSVSGAPGCPNDMDIIGYDMNGTALFLSSLPIYQLGGDDYNKGYDPSEVTAFYNFGDETTIQLAFEKFEGPDPGRVKTVFFGRARMDEYHTHSGTIYGHANANGAFAVGAAAWYETAPYAKLSGIDCFPACIEKFSSKGGVPILFDINGDRMLQTRSKPNMVAPDGVDTTFFGWDLPFKVEGSDEPNGFPNFFGTSAAAPHVAGAAALLIDSIEREKSVRLSVKQIYSSFHISAKDMNDPLTPQWDKGFDFVTGYGLIDVDEAFDVADDLTP